MSPLQQVYCQLCGVPFAINRIRTRDEPLEASWGPGRKRDGATWVGGTVGAHGICQDSGCALVYRGPVKWVWGALYSSQNLEEEDSDDGNYETESDTDDEILEYDSSASDDEDGHGSDEEEEGSGDSFTRAFSVWGPTPADDEMERLPLSTLNGLSDDTATGGPSASNKACEYEHIAGPTCQHLGGYHGDKISAAEMRGCTTIQCLIAKPDDRQPLRDDLAFEQVSAYHLTGLAEDITSGGKVEFSPPPRHWVYDIVAGNDTNPTQNGYGAPQFGAAFHPTCFELFMIASRKSLGYVDADGLVNLWKHYCESIDTGENFCERDQDVGKAFGKEWTHYTEDEYLAANPIFIPGFREMCETTISSDEGFNVQQSAFKPRRRSQEPSSSNDPFLSLPSRLIPKIASYLTNDEISALRLSSHAFEQLPISLWHQLLVDEFPFIYEAWCDNARPNSWVFPGAAYVMPTGLEEEDSEQQHNREVDIIRPYGQTALPEWNVYQLAHALFRESSVYNDGIRHRATMPWEPRGLPYDRTNWHKLFRDVTSNWKELKGLRNRARIWNDCVKIVDKIKQTRDRENAEGEV
ncbi:hypothetical protein EDB80DRAFT_457265 [Ilyonectria destructans]|nr:hypothetical protein EDB80DRAFT_457265 [Ilyonectria destructans]